MIMEKYVEVNWRRSIGNIEIVLSMGFVGFSWW
jgi:hypothetical protein